MSYDTKGHEQPPAYGAPAPGMYPTTQQPQPSAAYGGPPTNTTTVIVNQPTNMGPRLWVTGVCGICDDVGICLCGTFCGICLACQVSTDMGESALVPCCVPGGLITLRAKWRGQENIQGSICDDCITMQCCGPCAMCQLAREVSMKKKGILRSA